MTAPWTWSAKLVSLLHNIPYYLSVLHVRCYSSDDLTGVRGSRITPALSFIHCQNVRADTLVAEILKHAADIPTELRELVVSGAEGNPFYTEELVKMLIEDGVVIAEEEIWEIDLSRMEEVDVPSTLAGVLQARLDSLPPQERTVLQQASVVGRLFWDRIVTYIQAEEGNGADPRLIPQSLTHYEIENLSIATRNLRLLVQSNISSSMMCCAK